MKTAEKQHGDKKKKTLAMAESDITRTHLLYPKMGGRQWYDKYDALLKVIQKLRGNKRPAGLGGRSKNAARNSTAAASKAPASN